MKYKNHILKKILDSDIDWGYYVEIYRDGKFITSAADWNNAKEFVDTFDGKNYDWNVLC